MAGCKLSLARIILSPNSAKLKDLRDNKMTKQKIRTNMTLAAVVLTFAALVALSYLAPRVQNIETVSSQEIEDILYKRVDEYNQAVLELPGMADIVTTAETNPDQLTAEERRLYLSHERKFYDGWEVAWNYYNAGYFDADRWNEWNSWYVDVFGLHPKFGWTENSEYFSEAFRNYVNDSVGSR